MDIYVKLEAWFDEKCCVSDQLRGQNCLSHLLDRYFNMSSFHIDSASANSAEAKKAELRMTEKKCCKSKFPPQLEPRASGVYMCTSAGLHSTLLTASQACEEDLQDITEIYKTPRCTHSTRERDKPCL